jgi:hypothetical protein
MAIIFEPTAAPDSGNREISVLADAWAAMAVRDTLDPDADDILRRYQQLLSPRNVVVGSIGSN